MSGVIGGHQGAEMAMGWTHPTTGPNQHHKTGTRGKRRRGRPITTWRRSLDTELRTYGISLGRSQAQRTGPYWMENCS